MKIVKIFQDECADNPSETSDGMWTLYSFSRKHRSYRDPSEFFTDKGKPRTWLQNKLRVGLAFVCSYFEHGNCVWSLRGEGPQCQWDNVDVAGIVVWEHKPGDMGVKGVDARRKDAAAFLEVYTAWCNGEIYAYSVEERVELSCGHTEERDVDSCGGYYGVKADIDYMKSCIRDAVNGDKVELANDLARSFFTPDDFKLAKAEA